jgi:hypothetical protein
MKYTYVHVLGFLPVMRTHFAVYTKESKSMYIQYRHILGEKAEEGVAV